jgi:hypothetical protein
MAEPKVGDRIKLLSQMKNSNSKWMPVEDGMEPGLEGTIDYVNFSGPREFHQIGVKWDNGRSLSILPGVDSYRIIEEKANAASA